jgi:rhamnosyltransferase subunit B
VNRPAGKLSAAGSGIAGRRFVLAPYGSAGDVYPFLWLGRELQKQGASVVMVSSPVFAEAARRVNIRLFPIGAEEDFHRLAGDPDFWHPFKGPWRVLGAARQWFEPLAEAIASLLRPQHSVLVASAPNFPATFAARKARRPHITVHLQPVAVFSAEATPLLGHGLAWFHYLPKFAKRLCFYCPNPIDWGFHGVLKKLCREAGIPHPRSLLHDWWDSPDGVLCFFPPWFAPPQADWPKPLVQTDFPLFDPMHFDEGRLDEPLETFLQAGAKPVVVTAGSAMGCPGNFFSAAADAIRSLGQRAVFVTAYPEKLPEELPPDILVVRYASFAGLFRRAAAVIHHGGIGTLAQALTAAVPQLIVPLSHDQPDNAERIERLGCGISLGSRRLNGKVLATKLSRLLAEGNYRRAAAQLALGMAPPGTPSSAAPAVQAIASFLEVARTNSARNRPE